LLSANSFSPKRGSILNPYGKSSLYVLESTVGIVWLRLKDAVGTLAVDLIGSNTAEYPIGCKLGLLSNVLSL